MMLKMQNKIESSGTKFGEEAHKLNESFQQIKSDFKSNFDVNSHSKIALLTWRGNAGLIQYSWREHVEIVSTPTSVLDNEFEETFCKIVEKVEVKINDRNKSCNCLGSQGHIIVKFCHRKDKFNRGPESMFSNFLQILHNICLFLRAKYFLKISASQLNLVLLYGRFRFRDCPKISSLQISLIFRDSYSQIAFAVSLTRVTSRI